MKNSRILIIAAFVSVISLNGCYDNFYFIEGDGNIVTETIDLEAINGIVMQGIDDVDISYGPEQQITVTGDENIIQMISHEVKDGKWYIRLLGKHFRNYNLKYYITLPNINLIENEGIAKVTVNDFVNNGNLDVFLKGTGSIELNRMENTENLYVNIEGFGRVEGHGEFPSMKNLDIVITGMGSFLGYPINSANCYVDIIGAGKCNVSVDENLDVIIEGSGTVNYKGNPYISKQIIGLGCVKSTN